jgi:diguanylate cyclase (GGDEF)-like protein
VRIDTTDQDKAKTPPQHSIVPGAWTRLLNKSSFQFAAVDRATPLSMFAHVINVTVALVAFHTSVPVGPLALWGAASYAVAVWLVVRAMFRARRKARAGASPSGRTPSTRKAVVFGALLAAPWGVLGFWLLGELPQQQELILIALCVGMSAAGSVLLSAVYPAAVTYMACILVPVGLRCFLLQGSEYLLLGTLALSFAIFLLNLIDNYARLFADKQRAVEELRRSLVAAENAQREIEHAAMHDALTGLPNRRAFLGRTLGLTDSDEAACALFYFDLDRFKPVNDTFGHGVGDKLLQAVGLRLGACARPGDFVARLGGDEFILLAGNIANEVETEARAAAILDSLTHPYSIDGHPITIGVSIGVVIVDRDTGDMTQMLKVADLALYKAKRNTGRRYCVYQPSMLMELQARQNAEKALHLAIEDRQLELHYQPVVELSSQHLVGVEALLRWRHPERGLIAPGEFLPLAEEIHLLHAIETWVLEEACRQAVLWPDYVTIAVNVSPSLVVYTEIAATVANILSATGLRGERLELEVTESAILDNDGQTRRKLGELKALGLSLAMDDFGTGYSSLAYLSRFPFDRIKIDRAFVQGLLKDSGSALIVRATTDMARSLGLRTTAEGVETALQSSILQELGIEYGQGYLFSKPVPADELPVLFLRGLAPDSSRAAAANRLDRDSA